MSKKKKGGSIVLIIIAIYILANGLFWPLLGFAGVIAAIVAIISILANKSGKSGSNRSSSMSANEARTSTNSSANANPYSSKIRYSASGSTISAQKVPGNSNADSPVEVQLSKREQRKIAKEAARKAAEEAAYNRAVEAEKAKDDAKRKEAEEAAAKALAKKKSEQTLMDKYNVPRTARTGDSAIDKMLDDEELAIAEMRRLDDNIEDEKVSAQIVHLEDVTRKITNYVVSHPDKRKEVRRFFSYYLPTTIKLLNSYDRADNTGIAGTNIDGTKGQVEDMMDKALEAFDKQLDALYADEAMDVSTEIKVMEGLLAQDTFTDEIMESQIGQ